MNRYIAMILVGLVSGCATPAKIGGADSDAQIVSQVFRDHMSDVKRCYESGTKQTGHVSFGFSVNGNGGITKMNTFDSTVGDAAEGCLTGSIMGWTFPNLSLKTIYYEINFLEQGRIDFSMGKPEVDREQIRSVMKAHIKEVRTCYEDAMKQQRDLEGKVVLTFEIGDAGKVTRAVVTTSTAKSKPLESCMLAALRTWSFPLPPKGKTVEVSYPYFFSK